MAFPSFPKCYQKKNKPHKFCPGCGHGIVLRCLGEAIDELKIQSKTVLGFDIGCSLLAWDFFKINSLQTHHGRTLPVMTGLKIAQPEAICLAYMGDGGAYAIGAQHLVNAAMRDDKITVIVVNNTLYGMTGGQKAPTTIPGQITTTTPFGADKRFIRGPEMIRSGIASEDAYIARGTVANPFQLKSFIKKAILNQIENKGFSFVEALSLCPINWKTDAKKSWQFLEEVLVKYFPIGEI